MLIDDDVMPVMPYHSPMTKKGFFKKYEYIYDAENNCYICPNNQILKYSTTNRDGYREYKSKGKICANCPDRVKCTESKNHVKLIQRHIWADYMDIVEDLRHTDEGKELYSKRKETIERVFGTAKEHHAMRYTQQVGKEKMAMKVGLTFACMNMKKLANILSKRPKNGPDGGLFNYLLNSFFSIFSKSQISYV